MGFNEQLTFHPETPLDQKNFILESQVEQLKERTEILEEELAQCQYKLKKEVAKNGSLEEEVAQLKAKMEQLEFDSQSTRENRDIIR